MPGGKCAFVPYIILFYGVFVVRSGMVSFANPVLVVESFSPAAGLRAVLNGATE
jgi:hypothetical protein